MCVCVRPEGRGGGGREKVKRPQSHTLLELPQNIYILLRSVLQPAKAVVPVPIEMDSLPCRVEQIQVGPVQLYSNSHFKGG